MLRRSSRSRSACLMSAAEETGVASRATAMLLRSLSGARDAPHHPNAAHPRFVSGATGAVCKNRRVGYDRSRELGDRCGFCLRCGWGRRFMAPNADTVPAVCPDCGGQVLTACPGCGAGIRSLMALTCAECGGVDRKSVV